jgi:hypothetical protein
VSLVRGYLRWPAQHVFERIGHLAEDARVNVMLSRAREYLIVVGQYSHFSDTGNLAAAAGAPGGFWAQICQTFRGPTAVRIDTTSWLGGYAGDA